MDIKITHKEIIKPETPMAPHLQTYRLSLLDQLDGNLYAPHLIYFYPSNHQPTVNYLSKLRKSLCKTLQHFYPLSGQLSKDRLFINCKGNGAEYVEAQVSDFSLEELLRNPHSHLMRQLVPNQDPFDLTGHVLTVQATVFKCRGIAVTIGCLHTVVDGITAFYFKNAWAATARGGSSDHDLFVVPSFVPGTSLFPQVPSLPKDYFLWVDIRTAPANSSYVTRTFRFDSRSLADLRSRASSVTFVHPDPDSNSNPSRFESVMAFLWGRTIEALSKTNGSKRASVLSMAVNLRRRMVPPLLENTFGNLIWPAVSVRGAEETVQLQQLTGLIRDSIWKVDGNMIEKIRNNFYKEYKKLYDVFTTHGVDNTDFFYSTSLLNNGMYQLDFGFGPPGWVHFGVKDRPELRNCFFSMDTKTGDGIEVWLTLSEEQMGVLEKDVELLKFASVQPSLL